MRGHLYRGKDKYEGKWHFGNFAAFSNGHTEIWTNDAENAACKKCGRVKAEILEG